MTKVKIKGRYYPEDNTPDNSDWYCPTCKMYWADQDIEESLFFQPLCPACKNAVIDTGVKNEDV